jgi:hypothetical protein
MNPIEYIDSQIQRYKDKGYKDKVEKWQNILDAYEQEESPARDRMVIYVCNEYRATYRWEINHENGYVTVQLKDGSILPCSHGSWCLMSQAMDYFGITLREIIVDDPDKGI